MKHSIHSRLTERQTGSSFTPNLEELWFAQHIKWSFLIILDSNPGLTDCRHSFAEIILSSLLYVLAVVEDDGTIWPAVVIHQTQIWEKSNSNRLKTPLITHSEAVAVNLENHRFNFI